MDSSHTQERLARRAIDEERKARPVNYLSKSQKQLLKDVWKGKYSKGSIGIEANSDLDSVANSLMDLGLITLTISNARLYPHVTDKGRVLKLDNPRLQFAPPEGKRWVITTVISVLALVVAAIAMVRTYL